MTLIHLLKGIQEESKKDFVKEKKGILRYNGVITEDLACDEYSVEKCTACPNYRIYCTEEEITKVFG